MTKRFLKLNLDTDEAEFLACSYPYAFCVLSVIAMRARRTSGLSDGLIIGDAIIGSFDLPGLSRQNFRTALQKLQELGYIKIVSNGKSFFGREKSTIKITIKSMLINICSSSIYDINKDLNNQQINQRLTNSQPTANHKQEGIRKNEKEKKGEYPQTPFSFSSKTEEGEKKAKIKLKEFVSVTQEEHDQLLSTHGKEFLEKMLNALNAHKGSTGKKYESDFYTMSEGGWVVDRVTKDLLFKGKEGSSVTSEDIAKRFAESLSDPKCRAELLHSGLEISFPGTARSPIYLAYSEKGFKEQLDGIIRKLGIK